MVPKHKLSKLSIISDLNGIPLNVNLFSGNTYDSKILVKQLNDTNLIDSSLSNKNNDIFLADSAYDSKKIKELLKAKKYKKVLIPQNKRNIKNPKLLTKMSKRDKNRFRKRSVIERKIAKIKSYKRLNVRYYKYSSNFMGFVHLMCIVELFR